MSKHTPEPWVIWNGGDGIMMYGAREPKRGGVALMCCNELVSGRTAIANARRIVACVNACRGLPTDELEQKGLVAAVGTQLLDVERQRDELLAALEEAKSVLSSINTGRQHKVEVEDDEPAFWQRNEWVTWAKGEILPMIEAAIAKAKGGAA